MLKHSMFQHIISVKLYTFNNFTNHNKTIEIHVFYINLKKYAIQILLQLQKGINIDCIDDKYKKIA